MSQRSALIRSVAGALQAEGARGVLVTGSSARETATSDSDLDLLVVDRDGSARPSLDRTLHGDVLVEVVAKDEQGWRDHLRSQRPRWVYSFMDGGEILFDDGSIARLQAFGEAIYRQFATPDEVKQEHATLLWHARTKIARAASSHDSIQAAYWAALQLPTLIDALLGLANRPTAPGSRRLDVLESISLSERDELLLTHAMTGLPQARIRASQELADSLLLRLPPPDLERIDW
jgi:predicted nucleotidyltransferase